MTEHDDAQAIRIRSVATAELADHEIEAIRRLLWEAFADHDGGMTEEDWDHALGGIHVLLERQGKIVGHASVVERELHVDGRPLRTGYVEAVAIDPRQQRRGFGLQLIGRIDSLIVERFELGALATGTPEFYERLGWLRWTGPTSVRTATGLRRTAEEDGAIMILPTSTTPSDLDRSTSISCDWRAGDVW